MKLFEDDRGFLQVSPNGIPSASLPPHVQDRLLALGRWLMAAAAGAWAVALVAWERRASWAAAVISCVLLGIWTVVAGYAMHRAERGRT